MNFRFLLTVAHRVYFLIALVRVSVGTDALETWIIQSSLSLKIESIMLLYYFMYSSLFPPKVAADVCSDTMLSCIYEPGTSMTVQLSLQARHLNG